MRTESAEGSRWTLAVAAALSAAASVLAFAIVPPTAGAGTIVFEAEEAIYAVDDGGGGEQRLLAIDAELPAVHPQGETVVYVAGSERVHDTLKMWRPGQGTSVLTDNFGEAAGSVEIGNDGRYLFEAGDWLNGNWTSIRTGNVSQPNQTSEIAVCSSGDWSEPVGPSPNPVGPGFVYAGCGLIVAGDWGWEEYLDRLMLVTGSGAEEPVAIGEDGYSIEDPSWSPDGELIVFVYRAPAGGSGTNYLWVTDRAGNLRMALTTADDELVPDSLIVSPRFTDDGRIIFGMSNGYLDEVPLGIYSIPADCVDCTLGAVTPVLLGGWDPAWTAKSLRGSDGPPDGAPDTEITKAPRKKIKTKRRSVRVRFEFRSDVDGASFECRLDRKAWAECSSPHTVKVKRGAHVFEVRAVGTDGTADKTPATAAWKVKKKKKKK